MPKIERLPDMVARSVASSAPLVAYDDHSAKRLAELRGEFPVDLHRMRAVFPGRWQSFIKAHFRDLQHIQFFFGVSERTAREWRDGIGSPRAEAALMAVSAYPDALPLLMGVAMTSRATSSLAAARRLRFAPPNPAQAATLSANWPTSSRMVRDTGALLRDRPSGGRASIPSSSECAAFVTVSLSTPPASVGGLFRDRNSALERDA